MARLRVGTRRSLLALTQTRLFTAQLQREYPELQIEEVHIQTHGDVSTAPLSSATMPGLFVSTLRDALLRDDVDFIIHSMKDLPAKPFPGIVTACVPERNDARDALVSRHGLTLAELPVGARVGTSSPRRTASIRRARSDCEIASIRGNIDSRVAKVDRGDYDATILAMAGLNRIGRADLVSQIFERDDFIPAAGQGALSVECRAENTELIALLSALDDAHTRLTTTAERAVLIGLEAGCATAVGATADYRDGTLSLRAELAVEQSGEAELVSLSAPLALHDLPAAAQLGMRASGSLLLSSIAPLITSTRACTHD